MNITPARRKALELGVSQNVVTVADAVRAGAGPATLSILARPDPGWFEELGFDGTAQRYKITAVGRAVFKTECSS